MQTPTDGLDPFAGLSLFDEHPDTPELAGYGPIDTDTACALAGAAPVWETVRIDADTGTTLTVDRYRPSEAMKRFLVARDRHCRFPGCTTPAQRCDIDHTVDAQHGGPTSTGNLAHLCRRHHTLKHHTDWTVEQHPHGVLEWRSPAGRRYIDRPPAQIRRSSQSGVRFVPSC